MWAVILAISSFFLNPVNVGGQTRIADPADTVLLFKTDTLLIINSVNAVLPFQIIRAKYNSHLKTLLFFEHPTLITPPEGVYELYITPQLPDSNLSSSHKGFVNLLDLYSRTAPGARDRLEMDITETVKRLFLQNKPVITAYICIRFGPIKLHNGNYSTKAGELHLKGVQIVQTSYGPEGQ